MMRPLGFSLAMALAIAIVASSTTNAALIGYWDMNNQANDQAGSNDLNAVGDATFASSMTGGLGQAGSFDGDGDGFVSNTYQPVVGNDMSGVAWVWADSWTSWGSIVKNWNESFGGQFHFGLWWDDTLGQISTVASGAANGVDANSFPTGRWVHTAFVIDSSDAVSGHRIYVDGNLVVGVGNSGPLTQTPHTDFGIGIKPNVGGTDASGTAPGGWDGLIDEVGLYDEVLDQGDIQAIIDAAGQGIQLDGTSVPEPSALCLMLLGFAGLASRRRGR